MDLSEIVRRIEDDVEPHRLTGQVAQYIPALARIDPAKFGLAIVTTSGETASIGDADEPFSIQSISKVFMLTLALGKVGNELWQRVGREPSGSAFNSIVQLEHEHGVPRNPFINAGAITVADVVLGDREPADATGELLALMRRLSDDRRIEIDAEVASSEAATGHRNLSLAHFMRGLGNLDNDVQRTLNVYFHQCALAMSCVQLARAALFLAGDGRDPLTGRRVVRSHRARRINALMLTCGHYDASGDFAYRVGLPGKSGVGGGILAIAPGRAAMAAWSPGLSKNGNSLAATVALERLAERTGWSVFGGARPA